MRIAQRGLWPDPHGLPSSLWLLPFPILLTCCRCCCLLLADIILKLQNTSENYPWHQLFCLAAVPLQMLIQWYHNKGVSPKEKILFTLNCWTGFNVIPEFLGSCLKKFMWNVISVNKELCQAKSRLGRVTKQLQLLEKYLREVCTGRYLTVAMSCSVVKR